MMEEHELQQWRAKRLVVCAKCLDDPDLSAMIEGVDGDPGCSFCGLDDAPTMPFEDVAQHIQERLLTFYDYAVNQLMYVSAEGGYLGTKYDTEDLLFYTVGLGLPRDDSEKLRETLLDFLGPDEAWCDHSAGHPDLDDAMLADWDAFSKIVKTERRFFFHQKPPSQDIISDIVGKTAGTVLEDIASLFEDLGIVRVLPEGTTLYRARHETEGRPYTQPCELGPPPAEHAVMSNRMNPPGIPMFYGAESAELAIAEIHQPGPVSVGTFETTRKAVILDLVDIHDGAGFFSGATRREVLGASFLRQFVRLISQPVARDDRSNIEYIPTQVFTEFLRDFRFYGRSLDGIRYPSATGISGANLVLFATQQDVEGCASEPEAKPWLRLNEAEHRP